MSHTVSMQVEIRDREAFIAACEAAGGRVIGEGEHRLYESTEKGLAVSLPGWRYPIVLTDEGIKYDNYGGAWGDQETLDTLVSRYAIHAAKLKADSLGWYNEMQADGSLVIFHPDGGTLTVTSEGVSVDCVEGQSCVDISAPIEEAIGKPVERALTDEYYAERAKVTAAEGDGPPPPASEPTGDDE